MGIATPKALSPRPSPPAVSRLCPPGGSQDRAPWTQQVAADVLQTLARVRRYRDVGMKREALESGAATGCPAGGETASGVTSHWAWR